MKRIFTLTLVLCLALSCLLCGTTAFAADMGLIRFVPTQIVASDGQLSVEGCIVNMNRSGTFTGFEDFTLEIYQMGDLVVSGDFGNVGGFSVKPMSMTYHNFIFEGDHGIDYGTYACYDDVYALTFAAAFNFS